jgi:hypothetical protein
MAIMTKTAPAWEIVNNAKNQRIQEYNKARKMSYVNELGGSQNPYAKVVAKPSESMPFKVDDIAGEPPAGGRTYDTKSEQWKTGFIGRIAEKDPTKIEGMELRYSENTRIIKGKNLVTLTLHNKEGQQVGILNADVYNDGTAKIVDTQVPEQFGNRGYSKLMLSEFGERVRSQGVKEVYGEIVDELGRPDKARKSVFGNSELDLESYSNISTSGHATVSRLNPDAHYKVSDEQMRSSFIGRVAKENPNITKGIRVEFVKTRSSRFGDEYLLKLFKKNNKDGGTEVMIGSFNSEVDGNSASSGNAEIKGDFRNKGYGRLMYSEMAERLRALGAESWGGRMVDQARRPQTLRERVIDKENARLGYKDSETRLSDERQDYNGDKTFYIESTLRKEAHYKVSDADIAKVQERVDYLKSLMDKYEKYSTAKGRHNSDNKRRYWDAKHEYNNLVKYTLEPMMAEKRNASPDIKPLEGKFKVNDSVKNGVNSLEELISRNADNANLSPTIKQAVIDLQDAVRKQDATDEVLVPELRAAYDTIVKSVEGELASPSLTPIEVLKQLQKTLKPLDKKIQKNSERVQRNAMKAHEADMAEGSDIESEAYAQRQAEYRQNQNEGADLESEQAAAEIGRKRSEYNQDLEEGADIEANQPRNQNLPPQFPYPAPPTPAGLPSYKPSNKPAFPRPPTTPALPSVRPSGKPAFPKPPATPALPRGSIAPPPPEGTGFVSRPLPDNVPASKPLGKLEGWRGWTLEKGINGGFWKNAVGWMIVVQADKFKVYNPQRAMLGIYEDLEQAKRRVQRAEPKQ